MLKWNRPWWLALCVFLAACGPVQLGLEPGTATVTPTPARTETEQPAASTRTATVTAPPSTVAVNTVTPSATVPTATPSVVPPTATVPATDTRIPPTRVPPTAVPSATPTETATGPSEIISFTADRTAADPGERMTLSWSTRQVQGLRLQTLRVAADGAWSWHTLAAELPATGSLLVTAEDIAPAHRFRLEAYDSAGVMTTSRDLGLLRRTCPETYSFVFPAGRFNCAASPSTLVSMAEQVFEHGRLLWVESNTWLNPQSEPAIFVLDERGGWVGRTNTWHAGEPDSDPALVPPDGLYQPVGSFGKLWREELRDQFGWAVAPEQRYAGSVQQGWSPQPGWDSIGPGWFANDLYFRLASGDVVRLVWSSRFTGPTWELLPQ